MPIKPVMVRSLSRRADDWQAWQAGWAVHVVPLINCRRLGYMWADRANMDVDGESRTRACIIFFFLWNKGWEIGAELSFAALRQNEVNAFFFFFFLFHAIELRSTICWFLQSNLSISEEQNVQHLSEGKLKVNFTGPRRVCFFNTHSHQCIWISGPLQLGVSHGLQPDLGTKSQH